MPQGTSSNFSPAGGIDWAQRLAQFGVNGDTPVINPMENLPTSDPAADGPSFFGKDGWGNLALGGANTLLNGYMGFKQLGMAKDQLDFQKKAFQKNYEAQRSQINTQLRDRQKRRHYERPDIYKSPDEYMANNGVK